MGRWFYLGAIFQVHRFIFANILSVPLVKLLYILNLFMKAPHVESQPVLHIPFLCLVDVKTAGKWRNGQIVLAIFWRFEWLEERGRRLCR